MKDICLLIHTFNGYNWLWQGCIDGWKNANLPHEIPCYWGTDIEETNDYDFGRFSVIYSGVGNWSDRLVNLLTKLPTKYVFYAQEDHWPVKPCPNLGNMLELMEKNGLLRLQMSPQTRYYKVKQGKGLSIFHPDSKYLVSHQPSIWDKKFLLEQVRYGETPWINEYEGTKRLNNTTDGEKIGLFAYDWYHHACVKGKLVPLP
jgi:hypothetical protein